MRLHFPKSTSVSAGFRVASCRTPAAPRLLSFLCQQSRPRATTFRTISPSTRRRQDFGSSRVTRAAEPAGAHVEEPTPLSQDQYHHYADSYIDSLVAELEEMQEQIEEVDVEYTVRLITSICSLNSTYLAVVLVMTFQANSYFLGWCPHSYTSSAGYVCAQQTAAQ